MFQKVMWIFCLTLITMTRHPEYPCKSKCTFALFFALFFRMEGEECQGGWLIKGKWAKLTSNMYGVFEFLVHYLVHMVTLVFLYGKVTVVDPAAG